MENLKYYSLPIKSLNTIIKQTLDEEEDNFYFDSVGCTYKNIYYDFRVSKLIHAYEPIPFLHEEADNKIIHINQINKDNPILLCVISLDNRMIYVLDQNVYEKFKDSMSLQHKGNYYQLHVTFGKIREHCLCLSI